MVSNDDIKKYSALALIIGFAIVILYMLRTFLKPIFTSVIVTFLVYPIYDYFFRKTKRDVLSAFLVILIIFLIIFIPISTAAGFFVKQVNDLNLNEATLKEFEDSIYEKTGKSISITLTVKSVVQKIKDEVRTTFPKFISFTTTFLISSFIMFFVMFYLLIEKDKILSIVAKVLPFSKKNSTILIIESGKVTKAVIIGQVLTGIIQGLLGMFAFFIVGLKGAFIWGVIMIALSIIPIVGAFLVWVPAGLYLLAIGQVWQGVFILIWGFLVISQIDNIIRPKLVGKFANIHPIETFLGVIIGISTFGFIGLVLGPLIVSLFKTLIRVYIKEYSY